VHHGRPLSNFFGQLTAHSCIARSVSAVNAHATAAHICAPGLSHLTLAPSESRRRQRCDKHHDDRPTDSTFPRMQPDLSLLPTKVTHSSTHLTGGSSHLTTHTNLEVSAWPHLDGAMESAASDTAARRSCACSPKLRSTSS